MSAVEKAIAAFEKAITDFQKSAPSRKDELAFHSGSRPRTTFMRVVALHLHSLTGQWHDDWVVDLANVAFPGYRARQKKTKKRSIPKGEEGFTVDMVRHARKGMRPPGST